MTTIKHINQLRCYAVSHGFAMPKEMLDKSSKWLARQYNGIGAEWMPKYLRKIVTGLLFFLEPVALVHDIEFLSEDKSYWNFTKANAKAFYNAVKSGYFFSGFAFALICQIFGWSAWKDGKETLAYFYHYKEEVK